MLLVVTYHYIEDEEKYQNGIFPVSPERLTKQLDVLGKVFSFVSQQNLMEALTGESLPKKSCLITFDDGLRCQFDNARPILEKKGIPAVFFIPGLPYAEQKALLVHKIHWLKAQLASSEFISKLSGSLQAKLDASLDELLTDEVKKQAQKYKFDTKEDSHVKYLLNHILSKDEKALVIDEMFGNHVDEHKFVDSFYLSKEQLIELNKSGMLGLHSYHHMDPKLLSLNQWQDDLSKNVEILEKILSTELKSISYPYGLVNESIIKVCRNQGLKLGFTTEIAFNRSLSEPLIIARVDANYVPCGKLPKFEIQNRQLINNQIKII